MENKVTIKLTPQSLDTFMSMMIKGIKLELFYGYMPATDNPEFVVVTDNTLFFTLKVKALRYDPKTNGTFITPAFNE